MSAHRPARHLHVVPSPDKGHGVAEESTEDALPSALRFLGALAEDPVDVGRLLDRVSPAAGWSPAGLDEAAGWASALGRWTHGSTCYVTTGGRTLAYLPIYRPLSGVSVVVPRSPAEKPVAMLIMVWLPGDPCWRAHGLTTF